MLMKLGKKNFLLSLKKNAYLPTTCDSMEEKKYNNEKSDRKRPASILLKWTKMFTVYHRELYSIPCNKPQF